MSRPSPSPESLRVSELMEDERGCPCGESVCDCPVQIEERLRQVTEESQSLKRLLEAVEFNQEMRSASLVAALLKWKEEDVNKKISES